MNAVIFRRRHYIKHNPSSNTNTLLQVLTMLEGGTNDYVYKIGNPLIDASNESNTH